MPERKMEYLASHELRQDALQLFALRTEIVCKPGFLFHQLMENRCARCVFYGTVFWNLKYLSSGISSALFLLHSQGTQSVDGCSDFEAAGTGKITGMPLSPAKRIQRIHSLFIQIRLQLIQYPG